MIVEVLGKTNLNLKKLCLYNVLICNINRINKPTFKPIARDITP